MTPDSTIGLQSEPATPDQPTTPLGWAKKLAGLGYRILPLHGLRADGTCRCGGRTCGSPGKHPTITGWQDAATTDLAQIERWARRYQECNWGIATAGLLIADADPKNGGSLDRLGDKFAALGAPVVLTGDHGGTRGRHAYLRQNGVAAKNSTGELAPGVDTRADGGYVVAPGSRHSSGVRYEGDLPPVGDLPEAPRWLVDGTGNTARGSGASEASERRRSLPELLADPPGPGGRNQWLAKVCGHLALEHRDDHRAYEEAWVGVYVQHLADQEDFPLGEAQKTADSIWEKEQAKENAEEGGRGPSQATLMVRLAHERYDLALSTEGETYAVPLDGPRIARSLRSGKLKSELAAEFFRQTGKAPTSSARSDAIATLEGEALSLSPEPVYLRVAPYGDGVVIDLGDTDGRAVVVEPGQWAVTDRPPVLMRRTELTAPMPAPAAGGDVGELSRILNVSPASFDLIVGYLVAAFLPEIQHPVLWFVGEQGTGKTSAMVRLASLVDPSAAGARSAPRDVQEWVVGVSASYVVPLDNLSGIPPWLSDSICKAVTGDGLVRRKLYTDNDVVVNRYLRTLMMNGIDVGAIRGDLGDRTVPIEFETIPDSARRQDQEIERLYQEIRPAVLGGLLDTLAEVIKVLPRVQLDEMPRMADFAKVLAAVDQIRGTATLQSYLDTRDYISEQVVSGDPVATAVVELVQATGDWRGSPTELLHVLRRPESLPRGMWPSSAQQLGGAVRRVTPSLARQGVRVRTGRSGPAGRYIELFAVGTEGLWSQ